MAKTSSLIQSFRQIDSISQDVIYEFQKEIHKNRFFNNKEYLSINSKLIDFNHKAWHLRPEFFAYDNYGSPDLFHIILLVNDIATRFNFRAERFPNGIIAPKLDAIQNVLSQDLR